ncbi:hypothetical protein AB0M45_23335 [Nocardia sp. NPDC051787]
MADQGLRRSPRIKISSTHVLAALVGSGVIVQSQLVSMVGAFATTDSFGD